MKKYIRDIHKCALLLLANLSMIACIDGGVVNTDHEEDPGYLGYVIEKEETQNTDKKIAGHVTQSRGSNPIVESTVTLALATDPTNHILTTQTDSNGYFQFDNKNPVTLESGESFTLENGRYIVEAQKTERASSKIVFSLQDEDSTISLQQFPLNTPSRSTTPPIITVEGIVPGATIKGKKSVILTISVESEISLINSANRKPINISLNSTNNPNYESVDIEYSNYNEDLTRATLSYNLYPLAMPTGNMEIEIVSYDSNNNQSIVRIPFINAPNTHLSFTKSAAPATSSNTYTEISTNNVAKNRNLYNIADETILVNILVSENHQSGILVYRSSNLNDTPRLVGSTSRAISTQAGPYFFFADTHPAIRGDAVYYYKLKYYKYNNTTTTTSDFSSTITVPILPRLSSTQIQPANNTETTLAACQTGNAPIEVVTTDCIHFKWKTDILSAQVLTDFRDKITKTDILSVLWAKDFTLVVKSTNDDPLSNTFLSTKTQTRTYTLNINDSLYVYDENLYGKEYYWYVQTSLRYRHTEIKNNTNVYSVLSSSYPNPSYTINGATKSGIAHNAMYYFTIQNKKD